MENQIKQSLERIQLPPGAEARLQERIDAALDRPMREKRVILKPKKKLWRPALAFAAVLALFLLGFYGLKQLRGAETAPIDPVKQPDEIVLQEPEDELPKSLSYPLELNQGENAARYPFLVHTPSATWYLSAEDIAAQGKGAFFRGLEQLLQVQEADFAEARAVLAPYLQEEIPPIDIYTDFFGHAEESATFGAYYNANRREIRVFQNWDTAAYALLHEYVHYLSFSCTEHPITEGFFAEGVAEYVSCFACENRMKRAAFRSVSAEEMDFARRMGIWDGETDSVDLARWYLYMAEKSRDPSVLGVKYTAVSGALITRTEKINENPSFGNVSYYELGAMFAYLVDSYGEDAVLGNWDRELTDLPELYGKDFSGLYWDWLDWNRDQRESLGIVID